MVKKRKSQENEDPFAGLLNPFKNQASAQAKPRKRRKSEKTDSSDIEIASLIQQQRMARSWTQRDLADRASVGLRQVSELERGKLNFTYQTVTRVLAVLGYELTPQPMQE